MGSLFSLPAPGHNLRAGANFHSLHGVHPAQNAHEPQFQALEERVADQRRHVEADHLHGRADGVAFGPGLDDQIPGGLGEVRVDGVDFGGFHDLANSVDLVWRNGERYPAPGSSSWKWSARLRFAFKWPTCTMDDRKTVPKISCK